MAIRSEPFSGRPYDARRRNGPGRRMEPGARRRRAEREKSGMIDARLDGAIGHIVLDRPEAHNALDRAAMEAFIAALHDWTGAAALRAVVVTGRGRSFCAGASLGDVAGGGWDDNPLTRLCDAL